MIRLHGVYLAELHSGLVQELHDSVAVVCAEVYICLLRAYTEQVVHLLLGGLALLQEVYPAAQLVAYHVLKHAPRLFVREHAVDLLKLRAVLSGVIQREKTSAGHGNVRSVKLVLLRYAVDVLHDLRYLAAKADQYQEIIAVKLLYLRELLYAVSEEAVSPHELVARHDIRHRHACLVQHGLYLLRAVAHAVKHYLLFRLPQVIPQAAIYLIKEKCHYNPPGHIVRIRSDSFTHLTNASETAELAR